MNEANHLYRKKINLNPFINFFSNKKEMQSINEQMSKVQNELSQFQAKETKSGGTRLRKELMALSKLCGDVRKEVLTSAKAIPVKTRVKKEKPSDDEEPVSAESPSSDADDDEVVEEPKPKGRKKK
jgi:hypothetical protein